MFAIALIKVLGAVMLLLYAVRMVRTGFERVSGPSLRRTIGKASANPFVGALSGGAVAILLQSATAVAMLAAGFAASGFMSTAAGLAILLGADLGSALVVQFLSFDLSWLIPLLLAVGAWLFLKLDARTAKQVGRIMIGIALVLMALQMISESTEPLKQASFMPAVAGYLASDPSTALMIGALLAFLVHSSVAAILMIVTFVEKAGLPLDAAVPLVLGANIGAGLVALWLTRAMDLKARLLPIGNFLFRSGGAVLAMALLSPLEDPLAGLATTPGQQLVTLHVLFNLLLMLSCLPLVRPVAWVLDKWTTRSTAQPGEVPLAPKSALDPGAVTVPRLALASATRELLRMGEVVAAMARPVILMLEKGEKDQIQQLQKSDAAVNQIHSDIKLYIAEVSRGELNQEDAERSMELVSFAVNLERAGDLISKNLYGLALELQDRKIRFSDDGLKELSNMHDRVLANMQLAMNVLVSGDVESARELIAEKDHMRELERESHGLHLERLTSRTPESIESSNAHLEVMRSLKEINSLFAAVAVPILAEQGQLRDTRLVPAE
ncbi:Na/Pi cotransporter family protein [Roseibium sp.]|uniref:Na/Pi cotransporter family protein n=1 Tax=Roseibium sp. TaxID=1936156 RepID=UPI003B52E763